MESTDPDKKLKSKKKKVYCSVPCCHEIRSETNHLHYAPKTETLRRKWEIAIRTGKTLTESMRVCSKHFKSEDYIRTRINFFILI